MEKIGIIGLGRLGLCFALNLEKVGYTVLGLEKNKQLVAKIQSKTLLSLEPEVELLLNNTSKLVASTETTVLKDVQTIFCFVATPSNEDGSFNHDQIIESFEIVKTLQSDKKINFIICCTTMPGFCESLQNSVDKTKISVLYNPEFIAQGSIIKDQLYPDQILIGGDDNEAITALIEIYNRFILSKPNYHVLTSTEAEIAKLATNCFLTMKIAFANSLGDACTSWGANSQQVLNAIGSDSRIGNKYLKYGFGFGGPCFPRDNKALLFATNQINIDFSFSKNTINENNKHFDFQLEQLLKENKDTYFFESLGYKQNSDIIEESQQLRLALALSQQGKKVVVNKNDLSRTIIEAKYPAVFSWE